MAFCMKCGRPLPESGVCECSQPVQQPYQPPVQQPYQQPYQQVYQTYQTYQTYQPYQQPNVEVPQKPVDPNGFVASLRQLPAMMLGYLKDSVGTSRRLSQQANRNHGLAFLLLTFVVNLLATLLPGLVLDCVSSHEFFVHWLLTIVLGPAIAYGIGIGMVYALTSMSKLKAEFGGVLSVVGVSSTLPMMLLAASMLLSLIDSNGRVLAFFAVVIVLAWLLSLLLAILQTYDIKINLMTILAVIGVFFVAVILCRTLWHWYLGGEFAIQLYICDTLELMGLRNLFS